MPYIYITCKGAVFSATFLFFLLLGESSYSFANNKMYFVENIGQVHDQKKNSRPDIHFRLSYIDGPSVFLGAGKLEYQYCRNLCENTGKSIPNKPSDGRQELPNDEMFSLYRMDVTLIGANNSVKAVTIGAHDYTETYYNNGINGKTAQSYDRIIYQNIYPHIDWVVFTKGNKLKHEFRVRVGGKVSDIRISYGGSLSLSVSEAGALHVSNPEGEIIEQAPVVWQKDGKPVDASFVVHDDTLSYRVSSYTGELTIDPELDWGTYYGWLEEDIATSIVTDASGNVFMAGNTKSMSDIATTGAHQQVYAGPATAYDGYVVKINSSGIRQWATYIGGESIDLLNSLATDNSGNLFLGGHTNSNTGIATLGAHQTDITGISPQDAFLVKLNNAGVRQWGTYFGGNESDDVFSVITNAHGDAFVGGTTLSTTRIATTGSHQESTGGGGDAFLAKFNTSGVLQWGTYYGGSAGEIFSSLQTDAGGNLYAAGETISTLGIASADGHQASYGGGNGTHGDCFLVRFNATGERQWATYYGGTGPEYWASIYTDGASNTYLTGNTQSVTGIATAGSHKSTYIFPYLQDGFLVKFHSLGVRQWGTYFGDTGHDEVNAIAGYTGNILIGGRTYSASGIATLGAHKSIINTSATDGFLAHFNESGAFLYGTYYGGTGNDWVRGVACTNAGEVYIGGETVSTSGVATTGAHDETFNGGTGSNIKDGFLAKFIGFPLSVEHAKASENVTIHVYPNPTSDIVSIRCLETGSLCILSSDGRLLHEQIVKTGINKISLSHLPLTSGVYLLRVVSEDGVVSNVRLSMVR